MFDQELDLSNAVEYHYNSFPPKTLNFELLFNQLSVTSIAIGRYDQMLKNMHNSEILLAPLRKQEAVISSRMEGTVSTMDEILRYEADNEEGSEEKSGKYFREEIIETILYSRAMLKAQNHIKDERPIADFLVRSLHQELLLFGRGAEKSPGEYKKEQNYLADKNKRKINFIPIKPEKLRDGLEMLFDYINNSTDQNLLKIAISHIEFEALHPFKDGNGRVGRMLITLLLWKLDIISSPHFYISGYLEDEKDEYIERMRAVSSEGDWTGWCLFFLKALEKQSMKNLEVAERIQKLYEEMKETFKEILGGTKWHTDALDFVFTNPIFRTTKFKTSSNIPKQPANRITRLLMEENLINLLEPAAGRRSALYAFEPLLKVVRI